MAEQEYAFHKEYVDEEFLIARDLGYILVSRDKMIAAEKIIYQKGKRIYDKQEISCDFLLKGNLIKMNTHITKPDIEIHSETKKDLEELVKDLGLPEEKSVSRK